MVDVPFVPAEFHELVMQQNTSSVNSHPPVAGEGAWLRGSFHALPYPHGAILPGRFRSLPSDNWARLRDDPDCKCVTTNESVYSSMPFRGSIVESTFPNLDQGIPSSDRTA